jgi:signal transduction histidine kinase
MIVPGILFILLMLGCFSALGFLLWSRLAPAMPSLPLTVVSCVSGFVFFGAFVWLAGLFQRFSKKKMLVNAHRNILEAINHIAHGNFDVRVQVDPRDPHQELAWAVNKMAHDLGGLETMRQDFISNVSHEIQSPLTSISGFAALLKEDGLPDEERRHYAEVIEAESKRLSALSDNLLKLSALDGDQKPLVVREFRLDKQLLHSALATEPQWTAKGLTLEVELPPCLIEGDEGLLSQVWMNLLHNAIKFTPKGGCLGLALAEEETAPGVRQAVVRVSDTGIGIAPENQIHVFERFYKVDKARERSLGGNGLGLSLVKKIGELHGGSVTVESVLGQGSTFIVTLPQNAQNRTATP